MVRLGFLSAEIHVGLKYMGSSSGQAMVLGKIQDLWVPGWSMMSLSLK